MRWTHEESGGMPGGEPKMAMPDLFKYTEARSNQSGETVQSASIKANKRPRAFLAP